MAKPSHRPPVAGPPLIRTLARFGHPPLSSDSPALPAALGNWVDWNRAVALARALDGALPPAPDVAATLTREAVEEECARAHSAHRDAVHALVEALDDSLDAAELQRRHATLQRGQLTSTGRLRGRLRDLLAQGDAQCARLAEIDAVMEQALAPREFRLLDALGARLAAHAKATLAPADPETGDDTAPGTASPPSAPWPAALRDDVRELLLAELDLRFHPIEGLLAALHPHRAGPHAA